VQNSPRIITVTRDSPPDALHGINLKNIPDTVSERNNPLLSVTIHNEIASFWSGFWSILDDYYQDYQNSMGLGLSRHRGLSPRIIMWLGITCLDGLT
jgi:hypothetical protein